MPDTLESLSSMNECLTLWMLNFTCCRESWYNWLVEWYMYISSKQTQDSYHTCMHLLGASLEQVLHWSWQWPPCRKWQYRSIYHLSMFVPPLVPEIHVCPENAQCILISIIDVNAWSKESFTTCHEDCQVRQVRKSTDTWCKQTEPTETAELYWLGKCLCTCVKRPMGWLYCCFVIFI